LPLPANVEPEDMFVTIQHEDYNPRRMLLDGTSVRENLRAVLYGDLK
jgi:hypothetical protein